MSHNNDTERARIALMAVVADSELLARQIGSAHHSSKLTKAQHEEVLAKLLDLAHTTNDDASRLYGALQQQLNLPEPTPSYTLPDLSLPQIEQWARSYKNRHGHWPSHFYGGPVDEAPTEQRRTIYSAFKEGRRGLSGCGYKSLTEFCRSLDDNSLNDS